MFSFITRWFRKSDDDKPDDEAAEPTYTKGDPIPFSLDFTGADRIHVSAKDCVRHNILAVDRDIFEKNAIRTVAELLEALPENGEHHMDTDECLEHVVTAYKKDIPFARIHFFDGRLRLQNDLFLHEQDLLAPTEAEAFDLIHIRHSPKR